MTHEEAQQLAALDAVGAASPEERGALEQHLSECAECRRAAAELGESAALYALTTDPVAPPPSVRASLLRKIDRESTVRTLERPAPSAASWWLRTAAAVLLAAAGVLSVQLYETRKDNERLQAEREMLSRTIAALSSSQTRTIQLAGQEVAPKASARVFLDPAKRRAFVFFDDLPANPADKSYQLWIIRADQAAPQSAGVFSVDANGDASLVVQNLPVDTVIKALAVTLEPKGGVAAPTGEKYLVGI
jgi:anti-sigma-K factor RskA